MEELKKIKRVVQRVDPTAPHETLLVLDANTGQNGVSQAKYFTEAVGITGIILTKLDSTAKGGIVLAICDQLKIPVRFIGTGETVEDLAPFDPKSFVEAIMS
jgi:fused signal recognition particle receptor